MQTAPVAVTIVTYNSEWYIRACLTSVVALDPAPREIVVIDNCSRDGTRGVLRDFADRVRVLHNAVNTGFCAAQNQAIAMTSADWVLTLNPDAQLEPDFLARLLEEAEDRPEVGTLCGRLLSRHRDLSPIEPPVFDSTGMVFNEQLRHFDRGWGEPDDGRYGAVEEVFGASAAAALYRRRMIAEIADGEDFFDPAFFAYREDADVAWRAQLMGWRCLYVPAAVGHHVRQLRPGSRRGNARTLNMHSVKNRFLMRVKNLTWPVWRLCWLPALARDLTVVGGCLFAEPSSLPAFWHFARALPAALRERRRIMARLDPTAARIGHWFHSAPAETVEPASPPRPKENFAAAVVDPHVRGS
ncbi:MAG: glycosyltransferase family 2 protein [Acidobacteria bacterium]|nr:glycosyltransferase family 2 protein [Acidobacteriota bacterium]